MGNWSIDASDFCHEPDHHKGDCIFAMVTAMMTPGGMNIARRG